jgi:hypothetical protein
MTAHLPGKESEAAKKQRIAKRSKDRLSLRMAIFKKRVKIAAEHAAPRDQVIDGPSPEGRSAARLPSSVTKSDHAEETAESELFCEFRKVMSLDMAQEKAVGQLAQAYYGLGYRYIEFANAKENDLPPVYSPSFHKVASQHLKLITRALCRELCLTTRGTTQVLSYHGVIKQRITEVFTTKGSDHKLERIISFSHLFNCQAVKEREYTHSPERGRV